jgi:hypothetical protein
MKERGQVFTLDMLFALILVTLAIGYSGQALEQATRQTGDYTARYSLERIANDAAEVLVKTLGRPHNWEENVQALETLGLTESAAGDAEKPAQNTLMARKLSELRDLCRNANWDPTRPEVQAVMKLFGGSQDFEVKVTHKEIEVEDGEVEIEDVVTVWHFWPGWDVEVSSGSEASFEVAVVKRLVVARYGELKLDSGELVRARGDPEESTYTLYFDIYPNELEAYDWYIVLQTGVEKTGRIESAFIFVNRSAVGASDYHYSWGMGPEAVFPDEHGGIEEDIPGRLWISPPSNYLNVRVRAGQIGDWVRIFVVAVPPCSEPETAPLALYNLPMTFELRLWR